LIKYALNILYDLFRLWEVVFKKLLGLPLKPALI